MAAFVLLPELQARLEWVLSEREEIVGTSALEDLTIEAQDHGKSTWTVLNCPAIVKRQILKAAERYLKNLEGIIQSRAGDETLIFPELDEMGTADFNASEIKKIINAVMGGGTPSFGTIGRRSV